LRWQVPFESGTLKAVGHANGQDVCNYVLKTAGSPSRIELLPDSTEIHADGKDVCQVEFRIVDENGIRVLNTAPEVTFEMTGPARLLGIGNGDVNSVENCKTDTHQAFQGRGLAILQTTATPGEITLQATAPGLVPANLTLQSR
jgi:beta-galactosidase